MIEEIEESLIRLWRILEWKRGASRAHLSAFGKHSKRLLVDIEPRRAPMHYFGEGVGWGGGRGGAVGEFSLDFK